jgi:hypothetical protein
VPQVRVLLQATLPRRSLDTQTVLDLIAYTQAQNYKAYLAHRRRTLRRLLDSS